MAKKAKVVKNLKRQIISERYRERRILLKKSLTIQTLLFKRR